MNIEKVNSENQNTKTADLNQLKNKSKGVLLAAGLFLSFIGYAQMAQAEPVSFQLSKYERVIERIEKINQQYSSVTELFAIGQNDQGQMIKGIKVGSGAVNALVVGTHHGNEYGSTELAVAFAAYLAGQPIADLSVYIIPVLNISGYNRGSRYESNLVTTLDSNRDYTGPCKKGLSFRLKSTENLAQFLDQKNIVISATLHTHYPAVLYPWGISTRDTATAQDAQFIQLAKDATVESGYTIGGSTDVLYAADGTFEDYAYWKHGIWSLLFEVGFSHSPDPVAVKNIIDSNNPGLKRFLTNAPRMRAGDHAFTGRCDYMRAQRRVFLE